MLKGKAKGIDAKGCRAQDAPDEDVDSKNYSQDEKADEIYVQATAAVAIGESDQMWVAPRRSGTL